MPARSLASLFGREPSQTIREDLRRLKQLLEAGEIPRTSTGGAERYEGGLLLRQGRRPRRDGPGSRRSSTRATRSSEITSTAICGSDLHIYGGFIPTMEKGDMLGHEFMGEVVEVGRGQPSTEGRRSRGRAVHDRLRPLLLLQGAAVVAVRQLEPERLDGREAVRLLRLRVCSATRTCMAAIRAARPSTRACRSPTSGRSRCPTR